MNLRTKRELSSERLKISNCKDIFFKWGWRGLTKDEQKILIEGMKHGYYLGKNRHLVCYPYTVGEFRNMEIDLGLNPKWFDDKKRAYVIPENKMPELIDVCKIVNPDVIELITSGKWI